MIAVLLGVIQGLTEFIPVSSKTHLVVVPAIFGIHPPGATAADRLEFIVLLHAGTLLALLIYFSRDLWKILVDLPKKDGDGRRLVGLLVVATIPAAVIGKLFEHRIEDLITKHPRIAAFSLIATAVILLGAEWLSGSLGKRVGDRLARPLRDRVKLRDAVVIGCAQAVALLPGVPRSGSTMGAGLAMGLRRDVAARFSFLMAIPIIAGADLLELPKYLSKGVGSDQITGFIAAFVTGFAAVAFLMRYLREHSFLPFAAYCAVFAVVAGLLLSR
jgi:undecaprenyl-diphosphatase